MKTNVSFRYINDRQGLIDEMATREAGLEPYMLDRTDMYWAETTVTDEGLKAELTFCIDGHFTDDGGLRWSMSPQYGAKLLDTQEMRAKVLAKWLVSGEHTQAVAWMEKLRDAGYFARGRAGSPNTGRCPYCGSSFAKGTSHPHIKYEGRIIYHHGKMYAEAHRRGLRTGAVSGFKETTPSLEEQGKLEPVVIGGGVCQTTTNP